MKRLSRAQITLTIELTLGIIGLAGIIAVFLTDHPYIGLCLIIFYGTCLRLTPVFIKRYLPITIVYTTTCPECHAKDFRFLTYCNNLTAALQRCNNCKALWKFVNPHKKE